MVRNQAGLVAAGAASDCATAIFARDRNACAIPVGIAARGADVAHDGAARAVVAAWVVMSLEASAVAWAGPAAVSGNLAECACTGHACAVPLALAAGRISCTDPVAARGVVAAWAGV